MRGSNRAIGLLEPRFEPGGLPPTVGNRLVHVAWNIVRNCEIICTHGAILAIRHHPNRGKSPAESRTTELQVVRVVEKLGK